MSSTNRYLEFNSSYRDRNLWPQASEFEIPISQTGRKSKEDAIDPVCQSSPIFSWTCNNFDNNGNSFVDVEIIIAPTIGSDSDLNIFIIKSKNKGSLQQYRDYYAGAVITDTNNNYRRIVEYVYLYQDSTGIDYAQISIATGFTTAFPITCKINDPSTIDAPNYINPIFFIPKGGFQRNAYISYLIYNETTREERNILQYEPLTKLLIVDTRSASGGPVNNWKLTNNYNLRQIAPDIPIQKGGNYPNFVATATNQYTKIDPNTGLPVTYTDIYTSSTTTIILQSPDLSYKPDNYYKNSGLRILPNPVITIPPSVSNLYNYIRFPEYTELKAPLNEQRVITKSLNFKDLTGNETLVLEVNPPFTSDPYDSGSGNYVCEILGFSFDNFNPFSYTGSLVSQQEMVCYEVELINLILPNNTLSIGLGGLAAFYPYFYVELSNVSSPNGHLRNLIYSNVPSASKATFRVPIDDTISPLISTFLKVDGDGMVQIIKFKPNDNLYFRVYLYDGQNFQTIIKEKYSPSPPEPLGQISCLFSIRRI